MRIKIDFVAFQSSIIAPGIIGAEVTLTKSTKYPDVDMEYDTEGFVAIKVKKDAKWLLIPSMNIKSMIASDIAAAPKTK